MKYLTTLLATAALVCAPLAHADIKNPLDPATKAQLNCIDLYGGGISVNGPIYGVTCTHEPNGDTHIHWCTDRYGAVCKDWYHQAQDPTQYACSFFNVNGVECDMKGGQPKPK